MGSIDDQFDQINDKLDKLLQGDSQVEKRYLGVAAAAAYADLSETSIRRLCRSQKLTPLRAVGGKIIVDRRELDALIKSSTNNPRTGRGKPRRS